MIILAGTVRVPPRNVEAARPHLEAIVRGTRSEPGCIAYSFAFDLLEPGLVRIFEVFADEEALAAHRASLHMAEWRAVMPELGIGDRDMHEYVVSSHRKI